MVKRKLFRYLAILGVLSLSLLYYGYREFNRKNADTATLKPAYDFQASALINRFEKSGQEANTTLSGKVISVAGRVKSTEKDSTGKYTLVIGDSTSLSSVRCNMSTNGNDKSLQSVAGDTVTVKGVCAGFTPDDMGLGADVILVRCVLVKSQDK